jgi:O-acetyl-ADP-ribose deacetylase (regulator of RNase III)
MGSYRDIEGNLITLSLAGTFQVISHGCNCQSKMGAGIAVPMATTFGCNKFLMELEGLSIKKLGNIDYVRLNLNRIRLTCGLEPLIRDKEPTITVVNSYTQVFYGSYRSGGVEIPIDYEALTLCMRKINALFRGCSVGLPRIGAGLAKGDWSVISDIIKRELNECDVTVVTLPK